MFPTGLTSEESSLCGRTKLARSSLAPTSRCCSRVTHCAGLCWIRVRWFYRKEDTSAIKSKVAPVVGNSPLNDTEIAEKEVFASLAEDDNLLSTVDGVRPYVLQVF
jgi:hypothetical protein